MEKVNLEKFLCSLEEQCTFRGDYHPELDMEITLNNLRRALRDQGLEYKDGEIVKIIAPPSFEQSQGEDNHYLTHGH